MIDRLVLRAIGQKLLRPRPCSHSEHFGFMSAQTGRSGDTSAIVFRSTSVLLSVRTETVLSSDIRVLEYFYFTRPYIVLLNY